MINNRKLVLDTFCEVYDLLKPYADAEFWNLAEHEFIPGAIYLIGREQTLTHADLIKKMAHRVQIIISNPHEGSSTLIGLIQAAGLIELAQTKVIWLLGGGDMDPSYKYAQYDSFLPKLYDYEENVAVATQINDIYANTDKPYDYLFLNGRGRGHRQYLLQRLDLSRVLWTNLDSAAGPVKSLPSEYEVSRYRNNTINTGYVKPELFGNEWGEIYLQPEPYVDTYFSLVTETVFDYPYSFRTEKIWKPIAIGHPFIVVSNQGFYRDLHNLGFKTFKHVIDESFDQISDNQDRLDRIVTVVEDLCQQDLALFLKECYNVCQYNQKHLSVMRQQVRQQFPEKFFNFINSQC